MPSIPPAVSAAFANQVAYCRANGAPITARVVEAIAASLDQPGAFTEAVRSWPGEAPLADALPLRCAGGVHALHLSGAEPALAPLYAGEDAAMAGAEALVASAIARHQDALMPWLDGPPQTNEAGRSSCYMAALAWAVTQGIAPRFECFEIGSSAGINLMMARYHYDLGGVAFGPEDAAMRLTPEWRGHAAPRPATAPLIESTAGCDVAPVDLTDPAQLLRLQAYVWPEHQVRFERLRIAAELATAQKPDLVAQDAAEFVAQALARPQAEGVARVVMHSIVWQYLGEARQAAITRAIEGAAAAATPERPLIWIALEANRTLLQHELVVRHWPGDGAPQLLARAHAHGAWIDWMV